MKFELLLKKIFYMCSTSHALILFKFRKFCPIRPERAEAPSPGHRPFRACGVKLAKLE